MSEFKLPIKDSALYPHRITFCIGSDVNKIFNDLKSNHKADIPTLLRNAVDEYVEKYKLNEIVEGSK